MRTDEINAAPDWRKIRIDECELRVRTIQSLTQAGYVTLGELELLKWEYLRTLEGFGRLSFNDLSGLFRQIDGSVQNVNGIRSDKIAELERERDQLKMRLRGIEWALDDLSD